MCMPDTNCVHAITLVCVPILHKISLRDVSLPINFRNSKHHDLFFSARDNETVSHRNGVGPVPNCAQNKLTLPNRRNGNPTLRLVVQDCHHRRLEHQAIPTLWKPPPERQCMTRMNPIVNATTAPHVVASTQFRPRSSHTIRRFTNVHLFSDFRTRDFNLWTNSPRHLLKLANAISASVVMRNFHIVHA